ncbi:hypothetical protein F5Y12DRAFT_13602 [Xylaria sp. FL1777]|nr:hypothetical protein F5Y12DRAFT_13602 [Xylaria sp. FL1777]
MPPKTKKKGGAPSPNLPSLFPTHDGSYGINTLINTDSEPKKGQKLNEGIAKEQSDDNKWAKAMKGKVGKKYGMNSNLKKAIDESQKTVEEEEHQGQSSSHHTEPDPSSGYPYSSTDNAGPSSSSHNSGSTSQLAPHIPNYNPGHLPFSEEYDDRPRPPYKRAELPSADPYAHFGINKPISPPSEYAQFYGMPKGEGSKEPISPTRPDTSRSFNYENGLFANATLQRPGQITGLFGPSSKVQGLGLPGQNQTAGQPALNGFFNPGIPAPSHPTPSSSGELSQFSAQGQSALGQPATGQPTSSWPPKASVQSSSSTSSSSSSPSGESTTTSFDPKVQPALGQPTSSLLSIPHGKSPPGQPTSNWQANPQSQTIPKQGMQFNSSTTNQYSPGVQPTSSLQHSQGQPTPGQPPTLPKEPTTKNSTKKQGQLSNNPQSGNKKATRSSSARSGRGAHREQGWPSSGLVISSLLMFFTLVLAIWFGLSSISNGLNDRDASIPPTSVTSSYFGFGTAWRKLSGLLPEIPKIDYKPYNSRNNLGSSKSGGINPNDFMTDLRNWMPESIWVQGNKDGKIKIPEDFWHALKKLIEEDDNILSLKNSDISEDHWRAIKARVQTSGIGTGESTSSTEDLLERKISHSWDTWLRQNDQALKKAITGVALTKDDFVKLYQQETASYQREIREALVELEERISSITQRISKLPDEISSNGNIARAEITRIIDSLVAKAISNAKLDAVAQGFIKGHANDVLANQVNFFGIGAGVLIDPDSSSSAWKIPKNHYLSKQWFEKDGYKPQPRMAALSPWNQEGECFCADPDRKGYGKGTNNITVVTSRDIIPQHLVVEHILPGATLDPGAMPKEIEVWIYIEEVNLRNELRTFAATQFPDTPKEEVLNDGFVKVGHFVYENKTSGDGVQVFKISNELAMMGAFTNRITVRAINNYGADHTCFYRLRLYGETVERTDDLATGGNENRSWF